MNPRVAPIAGWEAHIIAGRQYLTSAVNGRQRPTVFNNELVFQMAAMGMERLMVGACQYHRHGPADHTLTGLAMETNAVFPMAPEMIARIGKIEMIDDMCALSPKQRKVPSDSDVEEILSVGRELARIVDAQLPVAVVAKGAAVTQFHHGG
jgi:hypothetical protein